MKRKSSHFYLSHLRLNCFNGFQNCYSVFQPNYMLSMIFQRSCHQIVLLGNNICRTEHPLPISNFVVKKVFWSSVENILTDIGMLSLYWMSKVFWKTDIAQVNKKSSELQERPAQKDLNSRPVHWQTFLCMIFDTGLDAYLIGRYNFGLERMFSSWVVHPSSQMSLLKEGYKHAVF